MTAHTIVHTAKSGPVILNHKGIWPWFNQWLFMLEEYFSTYFKSTGLWIGQVHKKDILGIVWPAIGTLCICCPSCPAHWLALRYSILHIIGCHLSTCVVSRMFLSNIILQDKHKHNHGLPAGKQLKDTSLSTGNMTSSFKCCLSWNPQSPYVAYFSSNSIIIPPRCYQIIDKP